MASYEEIYMDLNTVRPIQSMKRTGKLPPSNWTLFSKIFLGTVAALMLGGATAGIVLATYIAVQDAQTTTTSTIT
ncbi:unnamed protein product, partial [Rotaria sordida]